MNSYFYFITYLYGRFETKSPTKRDKIGRDNSQKSHKRFIHTGMPVCMRIRRTILPTKHCIHFRTVSS